MQQYCQYYQVNIKKEDAWFFVAVLRSYEHIAFDRTLDKATSLFEIFVPEATEHVFLALMDYFQKEGIAQNLIKLPNRLIQEAF